MGDGVIVFVLENLVRLVEEEASVLGGVKEQVTLLHNQLRMINAFLQNSENERDETDTVKEVFIDQLRDVAGEAEDVIDKHIRYVKMQTTRRSKLIGNPLEHRDHFHGVANTITSINTAIQEILSNKQTYVAKASASTSDRHYSLLDRSRSKVERDDAVGFSHHTNTLIDQLLDPKNPQRDVVSIIGMGGLGKTKLARRIYDTLCVRRPCHFERCVEVYRIGLFPDRSETIIEDGRHAFR